MLTMIKSDLFPLAFFLLSDRLCHFLPARRRSTCKSRNPARVVSIIKRRRATKEVAPKKSECVSSSRFSPNNPLCKPTPSISIDKKRMDGFVLSSQTPQLQVKRNSRTMTNNTASLLTLQFLHQKSFILFVICPN